MLLKTAQPQNNIVPYRSLLRKHGNATTGKEVKDLVKAFQKLLDQITEALRAVYKSLTGGQLTPELKQMFDELLGKEFTNQKQSTPELAQEITKLIQENTTK